MQGWILLIILLGSLNTWAQEVASESVQEEVQQQPSQEINIDNLSLEDLLNMKTTVASKTEKTTRQAAGIVTVITKEEISKMGARDMIDVLHMVPGITFGQDVYGTVGLAMRGNWANEGKFSFMIDGQEINEILYSSVPFGNHFPVDHIKRIEIIRGPGSAIYGGYAELAVINVITEKGEDLNGGKVAVTYGQMREGLGRRNLSIQAGKKINDWDLSLAGLIGQGRRGDGTYTGFETNATPPPNFNSETYEFSDGKANDLNPNWLNFGASNGKWDVRLIYDDYKMTSRSLYGYTGLAEGVDVLFQSILASVKYDYKISESWSITPFISLRQQRPWVITDPIVATTQVAAVSDISARRTRIGATSQFQVLKESHILVGGEVYRDEASMKINQETLGVPTPFAMTNSDDIEFDGLAAYAQLETHFDWFDMTLGGRMEKIKTPTGREVSNTVPRFAITKATEGWHLKGLASQAFRTPSIFNFDENFKANGNISTIRPEKTTTFEIEGGVAISKRSYFTANIFSTKIEDVIVYGYDGTNDTYTNYPQVATQGFELEYRKQLKSGFTTMNYSYYEVAENEVTPYEVPGRKELLGIPQHKFTFLKSMRTGFKKLQFTPSIVYLRTKQSLAYDPVADATYFKELPSSTLVNLYFTYPDFYIKGLELGFGVFNLFDEENRFVQPYDPNTLTADKTVVGATPGPSREFVARLTYSLYF